MLFMHIYESLDACVLNYVVFNAMRSTITRRFHIEILLKQPQLQYNVSHIVTFPWWAAVVHLSHSSMPAKHAHNNRFLQKTLHLLTFRPEI